MTDTSVVNDPSQGNLTGPPIPPGGSQGQSPLAPQSPLSAMGPPPTPTAGQPPHPSLNVPPMPAMPQTQKPPPAPDAKDYQKDAMAFASAMAVLGAVAGRFTRAPGGAALNAFAGALKGWQTGNLQAYEQAAKKWEQDTKVTLDNNRQVMEKYKLALENRKANIDEQMSQIQLISAQYHDQIMYDAAASKNYTLVASIYEKNQQYTQKAADAAAKLQEKRDEQKTKNEQSATYWLSPEGTARLNIPEGQPGALTEPQKAGVKQLIELYGAKNAGRGLTAQDIARENQDRAARGEPPMTAAERIEFESGRAGSIAAARVTASAEPKADSATLTQLTKQKASIDSFERTAIANGEKLKQLADKVDKSGVPAIERWVRAGRQATGDVDVAQFNAQMQVYRAEVAKIISNPNLTGVLSDQARREVDAFMSGGASAKQIKAVVDLLTQDFGRRQKSIDDEITAVKSHLKGGAAPAEPAAGSVIKYDARGNPVQ